MIFLHFWIVTPQILSAVNQGKLAGGIAQSGTLLAYQMERLPPRRVQVSNNKWAYVQKMFCTKVWMLHLYAGDCEGCEQQARLWGTTDQGHSLLFAGPRSSQLTNKILTDLLFAVGMECHPKIAINISSIKSSLRCNASQVVQQQRWLNWFLLSPMLRCHKTASMQLLALKAHTTTKQK